MDKNSKLKTQNSKLAYKKPSLTRHGKLTELTRGGGAQPKEGGRKTRATTTGQG